MKKFLVMLFLAVALVSETKADDPWNIIGDDTNLLSANPARVNAIVASVAIERLGDFFVNDWEVGRSLLAADNPLEWYVGLTGGQDTYILDLDYTQDGFLTIEDYYGFLDDERYDPNGLWGYVGMMEAMWTPQVQDRMGNPYHNYLSAFDVNGDGNETTSDYQNINSYHFKHLRRDLLISDPAPYSEMKLWQWGNGHGYFDVNNDGRFNDDDVEYTRLVNFLNRDSVINMMNN